ncbi:MAG: Arm DNA-binding domain-containing protein, partial [Acidobacteriota bacterium]|nr:Arm DNA-binding domain-containing protein [Acidobacteriota bacterium]
MRLTEQNIRTARYEGQSTVTKSGRKRWTEHIIWDDEVPHLGVRITSTNKRSFVVTHRSSGRKRTKTLGKVGKLTLGEARKKAAAVLAVPNEERPAAPPEDTDRATVRIEKLSDLTRMYVEHLKATSKPWRNQQRLINLQVNPAVGT